MGLWDTGFRHIIDVDGQLLAIDANLIDPATLLKKANRPAGESLWLNRAGERFLMPVREMIRLPDDEVLFFETSAAAVTKPLERLAA